MLLVWVTLGGALGAAARHLLTVASVTLFGEAFPWGTLACNVAGSTAIGWLAVSLEHESAKAFWMIGVLGGFTTFSSFSLQTWRLVEQDALGLAALYATLSFALCLAGVAFGLVLGRT
jgi:CrcB protein